MSEPLASAATGRHAESGQPVGVAVVPALQDPRKDVLPFRDLFPTTVALRLTEREQIDMVLGDGLGTAGRSAGLPSTVAVS